MPGCNPTRILYRTPICGCSWASCFACPPLLSRRNLPPRRRALSFSNPFNNLGRVDVRLAVVSPFVDRRHGTERSLAELLERLASNEHCEIHLYAQRVDGLAVVQTRVPRAQESGAIIWHTVPSIPGLHLLQFLSWLILNFI